MRTGITLLIIGLCIISNVQAESEWVELAQPITYKYRFIPFVELGNGYRKYDLDFEEIIFKEGIKEAGQECVIDIRNGGAVDVIENLGEKSLVKYSTNQEVLGTACPSGSKFYLTNELLSGPFFKRLRNL